MTSGLVTLLMYGRRFSKIGGNKCQAFLIDMIFGVVKIRTCEGMRGAPIVQVDDGGVGGIFTWLMD